MTTDEDHLNSLPELREDLEEEFKKARASQST